MSLLTVLLVLIVVGVILWLVNTYIPMSAGWKKLINIVAAIFVVIWLLRAFGLFSALRGVTV